ncbi:MAG: DUF4129 domain-containing protein [Isosphaeraceae bacterium]
MVGAARPLSTNRLRGIAAVVASTALALQAGAESRGAGVDPAPVRSALSREGYPWYDSSSDRIVPILSQPDFGGGRWKSWGETLAEWLKPIGNLFRWLNYWSIPGIGKLGDVVAVGLALLLLTTVLVVLVELLRRYRPNREEADSKQGTTRFAGAQRIEGLPAGVRLDSVDPWSEAQRLRALGDYANAVIYLFAHQLVTLDRLRYLRLVPGRTGRQLVRTISDGSLRASVEPTLRLFEIVYYGHRAPTSEAFEVVWSHAQAFESLVGAAGGAS